MVSAFSMRSQPRFAASCRSGIETAEAEDETGWLEDESGQVDEGGNGWRWWRLRARRRRESMGGIQIVASRRRRIVGRMICDGSGSTAAHCGCVHGGARRNLATRDSPRATGWRNQRVEIAQMSTSNLNSKVIVGTQA
jgi:hypothetical protein